MLSMRFSWHPAKAESNLRKHGISFETAASAFADPFALSVHDRLEGGEQRWQTLVLVEGHLLLLVAHTVAEDDDDGEYVEIIHIIAARKADRKARRRLIGCGSCRERLGPYVELLVVAVPVKNKITKPTLL